MHPALISFVICLLAVIAEGLMAGGDIRQHFRDLKLPKGSPPMWLWIVIGLGYYAICFTILYRLLSATGGTTRHVAIGLLIVLLAANAFWNYLFFRAKNLAATFYFSLAYGVVAIALLVLLSMIDRTSALVLLPYIAYLPYAGVFQYLLWRLNS